VPGTGGGLEKGGLGKKTARRLVTTGKKGKDSKEPNDKKTLLGSFAGFKKQKLTHRRGAATKKNKGASGKKKKTTDNPKTVKGSPQKVGETSTQCLEEHEFWAQGGEDKTEKGRKELCTDTGGKKAKGRWTRIRGEWRSGGV